jgi:hypothetical protein
MPTETEERNADRHVPGDDPDVLEAMKIDESVPVNRALVRKQERDTFTEKTEKQIRIASEILKSTLLSTVTSVLTGVQYIAQLYFGTEKEDYTLIYIFAGLLVFQVCVAC